MRRLWVFFVSFAISCPVATLWMLHHAVAQAEESAIRLEQALKIEDEVLARAVEESLTFAPTGKTKYQLRGDVVKEVRELSNYLTELYELPPIEISMMFRPVLPEAAAANASYCDGTAPRIEVGEILFYRHYNEYMTWVVAHEVAHIGVCLKFGDYLDVKTNQHDERWESVMRDLGYSNPQDYKHHLFDMSPIHEAMDEISTRISKLDGVDLNETRP